MQRCWIRFIRFFKLDRFFRAAIGRRLAGDAGQTTAEYALVILGAAVVAGLLVAWAKGGALKDLFDSVLDKITP